MTGIIEQFLLAGTQEAYDNLETRSDRKLYFCIDTKNIYKGDDLYTDGVRKVSERPTTPAEGIFYYICQSDGEKTLEFYNNNEWIVVVPSIIKNINSPLTDDHLISAKAVYDLIINKLDNFDSEVINTLRTGITSANTNASKAYGLASTVQTDLNTTKQEFGDDIDSINQSLDNKIEKIRVNGSLQTMNGSDRSVNINVPTRTSQIQNDTNYLIESDVNSIVNSKINDFATKVTDNNTIDTIAEIIEYIKDHDSDALTMMSDITKLKGDKVDKVTGKGLSDQNYTIDEKNLVKNLSENYSSTIETLRTGITSANTNASKAYGLASTVQTDLNTTKQEFGDDIDSINQSLTTLGQYCQNMSSEISSNGTKITNIGSILQITDSKADDALAGFDAFTNYIEMELLNKVDKIRTINDWNLATETGFYTTPPSGVNILNSPAPLKFFGIVIGLEDGSKVIQILYNYIDTNVPSGIQVIYTRLGKRISDGSFVWLPYTDQTKKPNSKDDDGYVTKGSGHANKVWKTDENGNPGWRNATEITPEDIEALPLTGGIVTGKTWFRQGNVIEDFRSTGTGYLHICRIKINSRYLNQAISMKILQRDGIYGEIYLSFANSSTKDPDLHYFRRTGNIVPIILKSDVSTWDLYLAKCETYDSISIVEFNKGSYNDNIAFTWLHEDPVTSLSSSAIYATDYNPTRTKTVSCTINPSDWKVMGTDDFNRFGTSEYVYYVELTVDAGLNDRVDVTFPVGSLDMAKYCGFAPTNEIITAGKVKLYARERLATDLHLDCTIYYSK